MRAAYCDVRGQSTTFPTLVATISAKPVGGVWHISLLQCSIAAGHFGLELAK
jgi:hypothetical protein